MAEETKDQAQESAEDKEIFDEEADSRQNGQQEEPADTTNDEQEGEVEASEEEELSEEERLEQQLNELQAQYNELNDKYLRIAAEFENYKKRTDREFSRQVQFANEDLFRDVLPILDDLERAVNSTREESSFEKLKEGVMLVYNNFKNLLERRGVEPIDSVGEPFDPELHEAMMVRESDEYDSETVVEEFERGYKLGDKVLRHAKVVVSK
ncbi:MAG: nucleotide exchange factor GrpE [Candidatus Marinimicrobia bacterium]|nr:nucleotide exchange factor GrpE [Candidatus Neomarinimicrobiota bacterium]MCF7827707.1 nucleotide exchange factor GrpE [Candidatus Neomarinimicrobiota bacterium]MCF7881238.1 nucleotide exchange factor GrpE [Candidatus Neomarinimicrobiota bacterium]